MNAEFQKWILKSKTLNLFQGKVQNDIPFAPKQVLYSDENQAFWACRLNFGSDLKFEL